MEAHAKLVSDTLRLASKIGRVGIASWPLWAKRRIRNRKQHPDFPLSQVTLAASLGGKKGASGSRFLASASSGGPGSRSRRRDICPAGGPRNSGRAERASAGCAGSAAVQRLCEASTGRSCFTSWTSRSCMRERHAASDLDKLPPQPSMRAFFHANPPEGAGQVPNDGSIAGRLRAGQTRRTKHPVKPHSRWRRSREWTFTSSASGRP